MKHLSKKEIEYQIELVISSIFNYDRLDPEQINDVISEIMLLTEYYNCKWYQIFKKRKLSKKINLNFFTTSVSSSTKSLVF